MRNYENTLNEKSIKDSFTATPQSDDNSKYLEEELKNSDIPQWKDLYRLQNLPKKGLAFLLKCKCTASFMCRVM